MHSDASVSDEGQTLASITAGTRTRSGGSAHSEYTRFLSSTVLCFYTQEVDLLDQLCRDPRFSTKTVGKGKELQISEFANPDFLCVVYEGAIREQWTPKGFVDPSVRVLKQGDFYQELVLVQDQQFVQRRYYGVRQSKEIPDSVVLLFPKEQILEVFAAYPGFLDMVFEQANTLSKDMCEDSVELCAKLAKDNSLEVDVSSLLRKYVDVCGHLAVLSLTKFNI